MAFPPRDEEPRLRTQLCDMGRGLYRQGLVVGIDGNLSCRFGDDRILVTPSGVCKGCLQPGDLVATDLDGTPLDGGRPSSEFAMHLAIYRQRPDAGAVVHAHPPTATGFSIAGEGLDQALLPEILVSVGAVPLAPFSLPGTHEVPDNLAPFIAQASAVLLAHHGAVTWAANLQEAYYRMESVEHLARITLTARQLGHVNTLTPEQIDKVQHGPRGDWTPTGWPPRQD